MLYKNPKMSTHHAQAQHQNHHSIHPSFGNVVSSGSDVYSSINHSDPPPPDAIESIGGLTANCIDFNIPGCIMDQFNPIDTTSLAIGAAEKAGSMTYDKVVEPAAEYMAGTMNSFLHGTDTGTSPTYMNEYQSSSFQYNSNSLSDFGLGMYDQTNQQSTLSNDFSLQGFEQPNACHLHDHQSSSNQFHLKYND